MFKKKCLRITLLLMVLIASVSAEETIKLPNEILYGASVYPELQTRVEWNVMLDHLKAAHMNTVRVGDFSWGNIETSDGHFEFCRLENFLDDLHQHGMKAILGTGTCTPPQWLYDKHPEIIANEEIGSRFLRYAVSINHPVYKKYSNRFLSKLVEKIKDHPAVNGWQINNEIGAHVIGRGRPDTNDANRKAWTEWLEKKYKTAEELNRRLGLEAWAIEVKSLGSVPIHSTGAHPLLNLAHYHYRRNVIKLAFWPSDDSIGQLIQKLSGGPCFVEIAPPGVQAVPRKDGSLFVINTMDENARIRLTEPMKDRISGDAYGAEVSMEKWDVLWLE